MIINKELIKEKILNEISEGLESIGIDQTPEVLEISKDENGEFFITLKFTVHQVEEDNYIGLATY